MDVEAIKFDNDLRRPILDTITFFDLFDYPLTAFEVWKFLFFKHGDGAAVGLEDVLRVLEESDFKGVVSERHGLYFLEGRNEIIETRMKRYNYSDRKMKKVLSICRIYRFIPWIKLVAVGNMIGSHNLKDKSDIDLFIVAQEGRIWLVRFFCAAIAEILGVRPRPGDTRDKMCLSFYVSEDNLDFRKYMLAGNGGGMKDVYFLYWIAGLVPVYDQGGCFDELMDANGWIKEYLPCFYPVLAEGSRMTSAGPAIRTFHRLMERLMGFLEGRLKKFQLNRLPEAVKKKMNLGNSVVVDDKALKLHVLDRREEVAEKFIAKSSGIVKRIIHNTCI